MNAHLRTALCASLLLAGCGSLGSSSVPGVPKRYRAHEVEAAVALAESELATPGGAEVALARLSVASKTGGVPAALRGRLQRSLDAAAEARLTELAGEGGSPRELEDMLDLDLPRDLSVRAGIAAADLFLQEGERMKCYRLLKRLDQEYPFHSERQAAGSLVFAAGRSLALDRGRYGLLFHYRTLAPEVLEYFTDNYPQTRAKVTDDARGADGAPRGRLLGPEAFQLLAQHYERNKRIDLAIERHEDLVLFYPGVPEVITSRAAIPRLRLADQASPEYDRRELERARKELLDWQADYRQTADLALIETVELELTDCIRRLADNDLVVARFYRRVKNFEGAEYHARRALEQARDGEDESQIEEAEGLLADIVAWGAGAP
jgi:hypothetical protein